MILQILLTMFAGWLQRQQQRVITYPQEENRILKAQLRGRRLRLTDTEHRRLAALAQLLGRARLKEGATIASPNTLWNWPRAASVSQASPRILALANGLCVRLKRERFLR